MITVDSTTLGFIHDHRDGRCDYLFPDPDAGRAQCPRVLLADDHPAMLALTATVLANECLVVGKVGMGTNAR